MTRQRQTLVTVTYNDLGCIIDTKAEPYEEPNLRPTCYQLATDTISRQAAIDAVSRGCWEFRGIFAECEKNLNELPSVQPESCGDAVSRQKLKDGFKEMCDLNCPYTEKQQHLMCGSCMMGTAFDVLEATPSVQPEPSIRIITAHLKQRLWETALNNVAIKGTLGDAYADVAQNRLDAWMDEITGTREDNT